MTTGGAQQDDVEVPSSPSRPARLYPFRALRVTPGRVADPSGVRALSRRYRDAARLVSAWEANGLVERDTEPALHLHEYTADGITIRGLVGALDLTTRATSLADRAVLPHERIHTLQADELASRMQEMRINPAPILLVHRGTAASRAVIRKLIAQRPEHEFTDRAGQHHRLWTVREPGDLLTLSDAMTADSLLIADGHHRYAAYLRLQEKGLGGGWDRGLAMVVDQDDTPFFLGAVHRVVRGLTLEGLAEAARSVGCRVTNLTQRAAVATLAPDTWVATDGRHWMSVESQTALGHLSAVEDLHALVLPRTAGAEGQTIIYRHSVEAALDDLALPGVALLMPAPDFELLDRTLHEGRLLPEKATSFQPKPSLGVLMRDVQS